MSDLPESSLSNTLQALSRALSVLGPDAQLHVGIRHDPRLDELITNLPKLTESDLDLDGVCPICLVHFRAHLAEEEMALAMDSPAHASEDLGVTRLENTCRHVFCRKDISTWIRQSRNSCPTCRRPLLDPLPEESEDTNPPTQFREDQRATQMANEVVREVLEALGMSRSDQVDTVRRLGETPLPDNIQLDDQPPEEGEDTHPPTQFPEDQRAAQIDEVVREVLETLGMTNAERSDQEDLMRRLVETPLPDNIQLDDQPPDAEDQDYPDRSEFGMYS